MKVALRPYLGLLIGLLLVFGLSYVFDGVNSYDQRIVINVGVAMILAASLNLINGFTGQFSLGHAGFMAIGAYVASWLTTIRLDAIETMPTDMVLLAALLLGGAIAALFGLLIGVPSLRLKGDYLAIVTLGFGEMIRVILQNIYFMPDGTPSFGPSEVATIGGSTGISDIPRITTFLWTFGTLVLLVFITENLMRSTYGRGFLATRDDEIAAESVGVNTTKYKVIAFVVGAFFAGVAGGLFSHYNSAIRPLDFNFLKSVEIVIFVILGGMGSTWGVLLAAALLTYIPELLRDVEVFGIQFQDFRMSIYALFLILMMVFRPQGLLGDFDPNRYLERLRRRGRTESSSPSA